MAKVLAVDTNDAPELKGDKKGLWLSELTHLLDEIERAGHGYDLASPKGGKIPLDERSIARLEKDPINARYMKEPRFSSLLEHSLPCGAVTPADYAAIFLSGGH